MSGTDNIAAPFEGPEKLLEIWFAPSPAAVPPSPEQADVIRDDGHRTGLRAVRRQVWEEMLDIVKCKVLSVVEGQDLDAYLLRCCSHFLSLFFGSAIGLTR